MNYYVQEVQLSQGIQRTAGIKARDDLDVIFSQIGIQAINIPSFDKEREEYAGISKFRAHINAKHEWDKHLAFLKKGDCLFVQFPIIGHSLFQAGVIKGLEKRGVKVLLLIHDLEMLRHAKRTDTPFSKRMRMKLEEMNTLQACSGIIVHNNAMKDYVASLGITKEKLIPLEIFDYLIPEFDEKKAGEREQSKDAPLIIAGNLRPHKARYVYQLNDSYSYNLYGVDYSGEQNDHIRYFGSFPPNELAYVMSGSFGLVWDGDSVDTCSGVFGEYLKINNPHKTSLYLASNIPVIVWEQAALAEFVETNGCGLTVKSLNELKERLGSLTDEQYEKMCRNASEIGEKLRNGWYTKKALQTAGMKIKEGM